MAWSLQQAFPDVPLQMVAEEDSADLRCLPTHGSRMNDCLHQIQVMCVSEVNV